MQLAVCGSFFISLQAPWCSAKQEAPTAFKDGPVLEWALWGAEQDESLAFNICLILNQALPKKDSMGPSRHVHNPNSQ